MSKIEANFHELVGKKLLSIKAIEGAEVVSIETEDAVYTIEHYQDCCERVRLYKVVFQSIDRMIGKTITLAEEDSCDPDWYAESYADSHTWTMFKLQADGLILELWFLGESNGYYGETVEVSKLRKE